MKDFELDQQARYRMMEALVRSEQKFRSLIEQLRCVVFQFDADEKIAFVNPAWERLLGYPAYATVGRRLNEFLPPDEQSAYPRLLVRAVAGEAVNIQLLSAQGELRVFALSAQKTKTGTSGLLYDITDLKKAENELLYLRNYLSNVIDSMPSALLGVDPDGIVTRWNKEAIRLMGVPSEDAAGQPLARVFPPLAAEVERVREAVRTGEVLVDARRAREASGETRYEDITIFPIIANNKASAVIRVDDVTERVRIEEMMVQSEKMLSMGGLAAGMAHEINNPLAGMIQTASVMSNRLTNPELPANKQAAEKAGTTMEAIRAFIEQRGVLRMLEHIRESGNRAAEIVANMLSFARQCDATFSAHNLAVLIDQCVDLAGSDYDMKERYDFSQIEILRVYDENVPDVTCEGSKIRQVLLNILRNGAEAMQTGKGHRAAAKKPRFILRLAHEQQAGRVCIEIEDNGPGMDETTRRRIFEPFFTTKPTGQGTGLGLAVSYFIITQNHGGEMSVESAPGKGATFSIRLPVQGQTKAVSP